jgi:ABC-type multidrug transport system ATPase subunit
MLIARGRTIKFPTLKNETPSGIRVEVNGLAKRFNREWIFRRLNYTFVPNTTYAVTGPNGSGKSTLLQVLWGQTPPSSGAMQYQQGEMTIPIEDIYKRISIATPYMDLIDEFTLEELVQFHFKLKRLRDGLTPEAVVEKMSLQNARKKQIGNLSSGMRQRVKLGLAFSAEADIVFLDEPGTNLDKTAFQWYLDQLAEIQSKSMIFIASNDPREYLTANEILNILDFK